MSSTEYFTDNSTEKEVLANIRADLAESLKEKYGIESQEKVDDFLKLQGIHESNMEGLQLLNKLIGHAINEVTIDANSNAYEKSIPAITREVSQPRDKLIGYSFLYWSLKHLYGKEVAKKCMKEVYDYSIGVNDATQLLKVYSYYAHTPVFVKINGEEYYMSLKRLFEYFEKYSFEGNNDDYFINAEKIYEESIAHGNVINYTKNHKVSKMGLIKNIPCKKINIQVWDSENGWVELKRIIKHKNEKDMILYQTDDGDFACVTEDHPVFMKDGSEKNASQLNIGDEVLKVENTPKQTENFIVDPLLAYFTGFIVGDGNVVSGDLEYFQKHLGMKFGVSFKRGGNTVSIFQKDVIKSRIYNIAKEVFVDANFYQFDPGTKMQIGFSSQDYMYLCSAIFGFTHKENSFTKHLPINIFDWNKEAKIAFICGLIDSDGSINDGRVSIRMMSYATINGLYELLKGIDCAYGIRKRIDGKDIKNCIFEVCFNVKEDSLFLKYSEKISNTPKEDLKYKNPIFNNRKRGSSIFKIIRFNKSEIDDTRFLKKELEYVYDITTSTGRFYANGMVQHNCWSLDSSFLITEGRKFGQLPSAPCKNIRSYVSSLSETLHQLSNHTAGAIAASTFLFDMAHLLLYKHKMDIRELKTNKYMRKEIENSIQQFVHSLNMLSRNSLQSPFSNISIHDRTKLRKIVTDMEFMFPFDQLPISEPTGIFTEEEKKEFYLTYIIDYIMVLQEIYLDFIDKGAPTLNGAPYRFPVNTLCLGKKRVGEYGKFTVVDKDFLKKVCKLDICRYNIFSSEGDKFASCCFDGKQKIHVLIGTEEKVVTIEEAVKIPCVKVKYNGEWYSTSPVILDYNDYIYRVTLENGIVLNVTPDHLHPVYITNKHYVDIKTENLMVGNELFTTNGRVKITNIRLAPYNGKVYCFKVENDKQYFEIEDGILTHNCRLINNAELMDSYASQSNSFGAGGSVSIGAHRAVPIDYPRIAIEAKDEDDFFDILGYRLDISAKILKAHKVLIQKLEQAGLQPFITMGVLRLDRMFSIFGVIGIYECAEIFKKKFNDDRDCEGLILQFVNSKVRELSQKYDLAGNIEQIPGESFAVRFAKADRMIFGEDCLPYPLLSNQAVPLWADADIYERLKEDGKYNQLLSGGGIAHATIGEKITGKQAENIITTAVECGCEHFALNAFWSKCEDGHMERGKHALCPKCRKKVVDWYTRVSGYFVPVSAMNIVRQTWEIPRRKISNP